MNAPYWDTSEKELIKYVVTAIVITILASQLIQGCNEYNRLSFPKIEENKEQ
jgi:hypothetical protein